MKTEIVFQGPMPEVPLVLLIMEYAPDLYAYFRGRGINEWIPIGMGGASGGDDRRLVESGGCWMEMIVNFGTEWGRWHLRASSGKLIACRQMEMSEIEPLTHGEGNHMTVSTGAASDRHVLEEARRWLQEYFQGRDVPAYLPLQFIATPFQEAVWRTTCKILPGTVISYGRLAAETERRLGHRTSARAVGNALRKNPLWIFVPCHRVVAVDGSLTGYAGGLPLKLKLLKREGVLVDEARYRLKSGDQWMNETGHVE
ncbi:MAG: methylated-DNA--[protein]-cysteine S-methyltransferase [Eubacteriales bacterium]|nr:methylated-DNA--[protein]-cysteine S-methyltransferase [Eubacteriales bacterium]